MLVTFQNKLHETTGHIIYTRATLHFLCICLCRSRTFDQSHSLMEADCAHNFRVAFFAEPLNVKWVCFVSKLIKLHFINIFIIVLKTLWTFNVLGIFGDVSISWGSAMISFLAKQRQEIPLFCLHTQQNL